jgi:hypothetical protein
VLDRVAACSSRPPMPCPPCTVALDAGEASGGYVRARSGIAVVAALVVTGIGVTRDVVAGTVHSSNSRRRPTAIRGRSSQRPPATAHGIIVGGPTDRWRFPSKCLQIWRWTASLSQTAPTVCPVHRRRRGSSGREPDKDRGRSPRRRSAPCGIDRLRPFGTRRSTCRRRRIDRWLVARDADGQVLQTVWFEPGTTCGAALPCLSEPRSTLLVDSADDGTTYRVVVRDGALVMLDDLAAEHGRVAGRREAPSRSPRRT